MPTVCSVLTTRTRANVEVKTSVCLLAICQHAIVELLHPTTHGEVNEATAPGGDRKEVHTYEQSNDKTRIGQGAFSAHL